MKALQFPFGALLVLPCICFGQASSQSPSMANVFKIQSEVLAESLEKYGYLHRAMALTKMCGNSQPTELFEVQISESSEFFDDVIAERVYSIAESRGQPNDQQEALLVVLMQLIDRSVDLGMAAYGTAYLHAAELMLPLAAGDGNGKQLACSLSQQAAQDILGNGISSP